MEIRKLSDVGGVEVYGADLSRARSAKEDKELGHLYDEHGLIVFRDQKLTKQQLLDAARPFGGAQMDVPTRAPDPQVPGVITLSTPRSTGDVTSDDPEKLYGDIGWHTDQAYVAAPNRGKILYAVEVSERGGMTGFIDGHLTYDALSENMKKRVQNLHVIQSWNKAIEGLRSDNYHAFPEEVKKRLAKAQGQTASKRANVQNEHKELAHGKFPDMAYSIVHEHPISGKKVLNVPPYWASGIVEMPGLEGETLLEELKRYVVQEKFQYWHAYRLGDALIWDNWRFLHAAGGTTPRCPRTLYGIVINPGPVLGYALTNAA